MTQDQKNFYIDRLKSLQNNTDFEFAHSEADDLLCALLKELGYNDIVVEWEKVGKWYA